MVPTKNHLKQKNLLFIW